MSVFFDSRFVFLDKKELLVDVKLPQTSYENDELVEDNILEPFRFDDTAMRQRHSNGDLSNSSSDNIEKDAENLSDTDEDDNGFANIAEEDEEEQNYEEHSLGNNEENLRNKLIASYETNNEDEEFLTKFKNVGGDKIKLKSKGKNRPSLLDYYNSVDKNATPSAIVTSIVTNAATSMITKAINQNEKDIDDTFEFLNDEDLS